MAMPRRRLGLLLSGMLCLVAISSASRPGRVWPEPSRFPVLTRLASIYRDGAACRRITLALPSAALAELRDAVLLRAERNAARAFANGSPTAPQVLRALVSGDFRARRTVKVSGFLLAETEAALAVLRNALDEA